MIIKQRIDDFLSITFPYYQYYHDKYTIENFDSLENCFGKDGVHPSSVGWLYEPDSRWTFLNNYV